MTDLTVIAAHEPVDVAALRHRLVERAHANGLVDVGYRLLDSPVGTLLVAGTTAGLVRIGFVTDDADVLLQDLADRLGPRILETRGRLDAAARQLEEYFDRRRERFELALDLTLASGFRRVVIEALTQVPFGQTTSYAALADASGRPRAVRATGSACATNPLPLVIGCHRVLRSDGGLGGYAGGLAAKRFLLDLEAGRA